MNSSKRFVLKALAVLAFAAASAGAWAADTASTDVSALTALDQAWVAAYNAGDADAVTALYADDALLMPPGAPGAQGKQAIRVFLGSDIAASQHAGYKFALTGTPEGGVVGDWGWVSGSYTVTDKDGHTVDAGKYLATYERVDGKWFYARDSWNSDYAKH